MTNWCVTTACCVCRCVCVYLPAGTLWSSDIFVILSVEVKYQQVVEQSWQWRLFPWSFIFNTGFICQNEGGEWFSYHIILRCITFSKTLETFMQDWVTISVWHRWFPHAFVLHLHLETPDQSVVLSTLSYLWQKHADVPLRCAVSLINLGEGRG